MLDLNSTTPKRETIYLCFILFSTIAVLIFLYIKCLKQNKKLNKYSVLVDIDDEKQNKEHELSKIAKKIEQSNNDFRQLKLNEKLLSQQISLLEDKAVLQEHGFYENHYDFENSYDYEIRLSEIRNRQKQMISDKIAAKCSKDWVVEGNAAKGRKMVNNGIKLVLRAFNGECSAAIAKVNFKNIITMHQRITKSFEALNKAMTTQAIYITSDFFKLKIEELRLVHEFQEKKQQEKEEQIIIKEQMREEARAQKEYEKAQRDAEREEKRYSAALEQARKEVESLTGAKHEKLMLKIAVLEEQLQKAHEQRERAKSMAELTRAGHVYVISNIGSFGEDVYKVGLTRRLEPLDRVRELGGASVPFSFDVHGMIYSEHAPALERALHKKLGLHRVNKVNQRKEFFKLNNDLLLDAIQEHNAEVKFTKLAEAKEYRQSLAISYEQGKTVNNAIEDESSALFEFDCPHCSQTLEIQEEFIGMSAECPLCANEISFVQEEIKTDVPC